MFYFFKEGYFMDTGKKKTHALVTALFPNTDPRALGELVTALKKYRHSNLQKRRELEPIVMEGISQVRLQSSQT